MSDLIKQLNDVLEAKELCKTRMRMDRLARKKLQKFLDELNTLEGKVLTLILREQLLLKQLPEIVND